MNRDVTPLPPHRQHILPPIRGSPGLTTVAPGGGAPANVRATVGDGDGVVHDAGGQPPLAGAVAEAARGWAYGDDPAYPAPAYCRLVDAARPRSGCGAALEAARSVSERECGGAEEGSGRWRLRFAWDVLGALVEDFQGAYVRGPAYALAYLAQHLVQGYDGSRCL